MFKTCIRNLLVTVFVFTAVTTVGYAQAQETEHIEHFDSNITVFQDGSLRVVEAIQVYATGDQIRHGIYRDFPTSYKDKYGNKVQVNFRVVGVTRDEQQEQYRTVRRSNGQRVYFGSEHTLVETGFHTYQFTYTVTRELGFFEDHDELYWNVTGNGWAFPIRHATAEVTLPNNIPHTKVVTSGFTGSYGSKAQNFASNLDATNIRFETLSALSLGEGLTIVVEWPKGYIDAPTTKQRILWFLQDNKGVLASGLLLLLLIAYYIRTWKKHGIDPKRGTVIPQYESPQKLSPAGVLYIHRMAYRMDACTAAVLALAVKGYVTIANESNRYTITKTGKGAGASTDELALYNELFANQDSILLKNTEHAVLQKAQAKQQAALREALGGNKYFVNNTVYTILGFLLSALVVVAAVVGQAPGYAIALAIILCLVLDILFAKLLRRRTPEGHKLYEEIEGFKLYMSVAEKDRLNFHNPPEQTPELFERLLPFALALGVEHKWAEQFASVFKRMGPEGQGTYSPIWYTGNNFNPSNLSGFSNSFSSAISSSSTPPGSSSGSGGGGSSGGGGGGGGGGGW